MIALGTKVGNRYARFTPSFSEPIEFGISMPLGDHKFLEAYKAQTLSGDHASSAAELTFEDTDFNCIEKCPSTFVYDLDGYRVPNLFVGPSNSSQDDSQGITQVRPVSKAADPQKVYIYTDSQGNYDTLRMYMADHDSVIVPTLPVDWDLQINSVITFPGTPRKPKMINVPDHANTLLFNASDSVIDLFHPLTGIINPEFSYRYSFYYRAKLIESATSVSVIAKAVYYTENDTYVSTQTYPDVVLESSAAATEDTDFNLFQIALPRFGSLMPTQAKKVKIVLSFDAVAPGESDEVHFDFCYPVLEHVMGIGATQGYVFIPEAPSSFSSKHKYPTNKMRSEINTSLVFDTTRLYKNHSGRKLYDVNMGFEVVDSTYVYELRFLENMNKMGYKIAFRPKHPNLPPVMLGDIDLRVSHPTHDFNVANIDIKFTETD